MARRHASPLSPRRETELSRRGRPVATSTDQTRRDATKADI
jgi:hypothetical protein